MIFKHVLLNLIVQIVATVENSFLDKFNDRYRIVQKKLGNFYLEDIINECVCFFQSELKLSYI